MALNSFVFPLEDRGDSRSMSNIPLKLQGDALTDNEQLFTEETAVNSDRETIVPLSIGVNEDLHLEEEIGSEVGFEGIVGRSATLRQVLQLVKTVAPSDSTVLLLGAGVLLVAMFAGKR